MGLLDVLNSDQGRLGLGLLAAAGGRSDGAGFGQRMAEGIGSVDQWKKQQAQAKFQQMQADEMQAQVEARKKAAAQAAADEAGIRPYLADPQLDPRLLLQNPNISLGGIGKAMEMNSKFNPAKKFETLAPGSSMFEMTPNGPKLSMTAPDKQKEADPNKPFMIVDGKIVPNTEYQKYDMGRAQAGAARTNVSVNTGQKGFDNTLKLRGDFRSEPIYKAHQEVQSAHSQISQALKLASPAGDLAGATKLMKILDPGSVVRESELGMAMAASGAMDRLENYAQNILKGTKLTPTQRIDFQNLADNLYGESVKQYNTKRGEYQGIAERNGLSVPDVLGAEGIMKPKPDAPSKPPMKGQTVDGYKYMGGDPAVKSNWVKQ